jgi:hypothetical protein
MRIYDVHELMETKKKLTLIKDNYGDVFFRSYRTLKGKYIKY